MPPAEAHRRAPAGLDRPVWASLSTTHSALSTGDALARRYARDVNLFASARDDSAAALAALAALVQPGEQVYLLQAPEILVPAALRAVSPGKGVQMIAVRSVGPAVRPQDIQDLADTDAAEMLALAKLAQPGPFLIRTHTMGRFVGIRIGGRLAAMAGERFRFPGYTELSGVCTHPDFRGRGLARRLSCAVAAAIEARGERPFLHAWRTNRAAISLYESLGFELRTEVNVAVLERHETDVDAAVAGTGSR
jgi:predicted GNAT family acetyltransferase